mmetsp:Transcript_98346/g.317044  ORF Transcript_98346/g.317044 Transcript_98346/m.317044 type:complete len:579 (-) Transcript_98346:61-1797(-)
MWARKCGAPPQWPSRVKVMLQSVATAALGLAVFDYMSNADAGYLDLSAPVSTTVLCLEKDAWPMRHSSSSWFEGATWMDWYEYRENMVQYVDEHRCMGNTSQSGVLCAKADVPLNELEGSLGVPLMATGEWPVGRNDAVELYGYLFLLFTFIMWLVVLVHDLALLSARYHNGVYDFAAIRRRFPCSRLLYTVWGFRFFKRLLIGRGILCCRRRCFQRVGRFWGILLAPVFLAWFVVAYNILIMPVAAIFFIIYPVRLSRVMLFLTCLAMAIYGVILSVHACIWMSSAERRQTYAIIWASPTREGGECICGCVYALKGSICTNLLLIGVGVAYKAFSLCFRCLKGLRTSNWAHLISVLFPIPLGVYEVYWTQPDGGPIRYRVDGQPVQAELAFDSFALMDEQPESAGTTVNLAPCSILQEFEPATWSVDDVVRYLEALHLGRYGAAIRTHKVDGPTLLQLMRLDGLSELGVTSEAHEAKIRERLGTWGANSASSGHRNSNREMSSPKMTALQAVPEKHQDREFVGCCGFPCIYGENSRAGTKDSDDEAEEEPCVVAVEDPAEQHDTLEVDENEEIIILC